jgi:hypothetical protein
MLLELAAANEWKPRWYYILINKTTNIKYAGQTTQKNMDKYCGSGKYWKAHCKKYGGYNKENIEVLEQTWITKLKDAEDWLINLKEKNKFYFLKSNKLWANAVEETTFDSAFSGFTKEQRKTFCKKGWSKIYNLGIIKKNGIKQGQINVANGHIYKIQKLGSSIGGKLNGAKNIKAAHNLINAKENCKKGGIAACKIKHLNKEKETGKSLFAIHMGKKSGETKYMLSLFCKEQGIKNPGKNYINVNRNAFNQWRSLNDCRINACESSLSSNQRGNK